MRLVDKTIRTIFDCCIIAGILFLAYAAYLIIFTEPNKVEPNKVELPFTEWECTQVVGDANSPTRIDKCLDPDTNKCYYINQNGGMLETSCTKHPLAD